MRKIDEYRDHLQDLDSWDDFLLAESRLPGPRANLELAFAVAQQGAEADLLRYAVLDRERAPTNTPQEFLAICGVIGLGYLAARGEAEHFDLLRQKASDSRWRIREAVALGLQEFGRSSMDRLLARMEGWSRGNPLERRAAVAALCEPKLLQDQTHAAQVLEILEQITRSILDEPDRKSESFRVLRKGLAYGWSVAVAAQPELGKPRMEAWVRRRDGDIRWIMKQNLKKNRLSRMDPEWVSEQIAVLESSGS